MEKHKAIPLWKCGECSEVHDDEDEAMECCRPAIHELFGCPVCKSNHDDESAALKCCGSADGMLTRCPCCARDYAESELNHFAVTVAGHCNTCNPFFSIDQQLLIQDLHFERSPWSTPGLPR